MKISGTKFKIGVISDTHNLLRPEAVNELVGADLIIHAGDIGERKILDELEMIAPVVAVRGNVDRAAWCQKIPVTQKIIAGETEIYVIHNLKEIDIDPAREKFQIVVSGHSHQPLIERKNDVLYINPGSAGKRRFKLPITLAMLEINGQNIAAEIIKLL